MFVRRKNLLIGLEFHKILIQIVQKIAEKLTLALEFAGTSVMRSATSSRLKPREIPRKTRAISLVTL